MISFEQIQKANEATKSMDVKGKQYTLVNERVKAFRMLYPEGSIQTEILSLEDGVVTMKTTVCSSEGQILATGLAQEKESSSYINKTSFIENCETSAVGRALGFLGIGIDTSIASAEEVQTAILNQEKASFNQIALIKANIPEGKHEAQLKKWGLARFEDMPKELADKVIAKITKNTKPIIEEEA